MLRQSFESFGAIVAAKVMFSHSTKRPLGLGCVLTEAQGACPLPETLK